jgi:hypothetical protein
MRRQLTRRPEDRNSLECLIDWMLKRQARYDRKKGGLGK